MARVAAMRPHGARVQLPRTGKNGERIAARGSQSMRLVVFGTQPQTWTLYAFGQRSTPGQPHADDQAELFSRKQFKSALLDKAELMQHLESTTTLEIPAAR